MGLIWADREKASTRSVGSAEEVETTRSHGCWGRRTGDGTAGQDVTGCRPEVVEPKRRRGGAGRVLAAEQDPFRAELAGRLRRGRPDRHLREVRRVPGGPAGSRQEGLGFRGVRGRGRRDQREREHSRHGFGRRSQGHQGHISTSMMGRLLSLPLRKPWPSASDLSMLYRTKPLGAGRRERTTSALVGPPAA